MPNAVTLRLIDGLQFEAQTSTGHSIRMDSNTNDSETVAAAPMDLLLAALGACTAMDVISILRKMRQDVAAYRVELSGERAAEHPKVYTAVDVMHRLSGPSISEDSVRRAIQLTIDRYCPVFNMLYPTVPIRQLYDIDNSNGIVISGEVTRSP